MKLTLFGATGRTGRLLLEQALAAGHMVTVLVRTPAKLAWTHERLKLIAGDVRDAACVEEAMTGAEGVLSVLGPANNKPEFEVSRGVGHIIGAMHKQHVSRLILSIGAGVRDPQDVPGLADQFFGLLVKALARNVYEDMRQVSDRVRASDLEWTIVRVPMLTDDPKTGSVRVSYLGKGAGFRLARADLAEFMLKQVRDETYLKQAPVVSN